MVTVGPDVCTGKSVSPGSKVRPCTRTLLRTPPEPSFSTPYTVAAVTFLRPALQVTRKETERFRVSSWTDVWNPWTEDFPGSVTLDHCLTVVLVSSPVSREERTGATVRRRPATKPSPTPPVGPLLWASC